MSKKKLAEVKLRIESLERENHILLQQLEGVRQAYSLITKHNDGLLLHIAMLEDNQRQLSKPSIWKRIFK